MATSDDATADADRSNAPDDKRLESVAPCRYEVDMRYDATGEGRMVGADLVSVEDGETAASVVVTIPRGTSQREVGAIMDRAQQALCRAAGVLHEGDRHAARTASPNDGGDGDGGEGDAGGDATDAGGRDTGGDD